MMRPRPRSGRKLSITSLDGGKACEVSFITYDLEDSVTPQNKSPARTALLSHLTSLPSRPASIGELAVRINAVCARYALEDLSVLAGVPHLDAIVVPKVNSPGDLTFVADVIRHVAPHRLPPPTSSTTSPPLSTSPSVPAPLPKPLRIIALIESARAITDLRSICTVPLPSSPSPDSFLSGLIFAAEDFALDLSLTRTPSTTEFLYARSTVVTAARAFGIPSAIDLVCTGFRGDEGLARLEEECKNGKGMGFNGKQCIHPSQVDTVQRIFAPGPEEVERAVRVAIADEKAERAGRGAWTLHGNMIDAPVAEKARGVVAKAERCGFDVKALREKWKEQEPE